MIERIFAGAAGTMAFLLIASVGGQVVQRVAFAAIGWRHSIEHFSAWSN